MKITVELDNEELERLLYEDDAKIIWHHHEEIDHEGEIEITVVKREEWDA